MIDVESFERLRKVDLIVIILLAILWSFLTVLAGMYFDYLNSMVLLLITSMFSVFTALLIRRFGAVMLFYLFGSFITIPFDNLTGVGVNKVFILLTAGIVFELLFLLLKFEMNNVPFDAIIASAFSNASIPLSMLLFIPFTKGIMIYVWNFVLIAFISGIVGAITVFLLWYKIKGTKPVIRFEYYV